ncbi:MAG TPA: AMP-binding protein, partial [Pseudomonadales bacterium]|nr:AMP-binding protein [Pseudomonadales bacterium]
MSTHHTVTDIFRSRAEDGHVALRHGDQQWSYRELIAAGAERAAFLLANRRAGPFHVGILLDNVPEFPLWLTGCILAGATMVGLNPTRRGADLARDITHTDCQFVISAEAYRAELASLRDVIGNARIVDIDSGEQAALLAPFAGAALPEVTVNPGDTFALIFTSGSSGAPKACICSHGRVAALATLVSQFFGFGRDSVSYVSMPWFHNAAISMGWLPTVVGKGTTIIRRFSVSGFLPDVRRYGVTHFNYVGKPLAYLLTAPEQPDDHDNTLRMVFGNEGAIADQENFARRFGCTVIDGYGSTEGGISIARTPDMPRGCLGVSQQPGVKVLNPETGAECARAHFDTDGRLLNPNDAIGELANVDGAQGFEGYWNNPEANHRRVHDGVFWTGDLAYRDEQGYFWFAGRDDDWLRVDGENIASAQIEQALFRHPDVVLAGVYAVPDDVVGDRVMAALQLRPGARFDAAEFERFLAAQTDFGTKWMPAFVRVMQ